MVVGTCGRVTDLLERGALKLNSVSVIILDEADEMLQDDWKDELEKILTLGGTDLREANFLGST